MKEDKQENKATQNNHFPGIAVIDKYEKSLKESEERFKKLSEVTTEGIIIHEDSIIVEVNQALCRMLGYEESELIGKESLDIVDENDKEEIRKKRDAGYEGGFEMPVTKKDGTKVYCEMLSREIVHNGKKLRVVTFRDIGVRKKYEQEWRNTEERYRMLVESASDAIFVMDKDGKFIQTNTRGFLELGYSKEEFLKMSITDVVPREDLEKIPLRLHEIEQGKTTFSERNLTCKNGEKIVVEASLTRFPDGNIQAILRNISKRKKAEQALIQSQENYKSLIEYSPDGIFIHDERGEVFFANPAALKIMGINSLEELNSKHIFSYILPEYHDKIREQGDKISRGERIDFMIAKIKRADGTIIEVESKPIEISFEGKKSTLVVYHDISFQRQLEKEQLRAQIAEETNKKLQQEIAERKKAEEKVKQSLKEKEVLLKEVHHRVKNNLQVISSILNLQSSYITDKKTIDLLRESQNRIKSMSFIHEILYQTRDFSNINFSEYIINLTKNLLHSYSKTKNIKLKLDVSNVFLNLDLAIPCGLIINEIVSNALKYAFPDKKDGEVTISVKQNGDFIKIEVGDNGVGLPAEVNYRNTDSLGLQLVMTLIEQIDGDITLENKKGVNYNIVFESRIKKEK